MTSFDFEPVETSFSYIILESSSMTSSPPANMMDGGKVMFSKKSGDASGSVLSVV